MNLTSEEKISNLRDIILEQNAVIESLCDILVEGGLMTEQELQNRIVEHLELQQEEIKQIKRKESESLPDIFTSMFSGPIGEC
jgi:hypothetical protein